MNKKILIDLLICIGVILLIYTNSLNRPWIFYDEPAISKEISFPTPSSFAETIEIIKSFGTVNNLNSNNFIYSANSVNRITFLDVPVRLFTGFLLQKKSLLYHSLNLMLHIINTLLVYLILRTFILTPGFIVRLIIILLTLIWACHPVHVESILLSTNVNATFSYL